MKTTFNIVERKNNLPRGIRFSLLFFFSWMISFSQADKPWAIGAGGIYNFQTNGMGVGARAYIPLTERIAISPQVSYFLPFNEVKEFYAGAALQYSFVYIGNWEIYALAAAYYNRWFNYSDFSSKIAKPNNFAPEAGIGIMRSTGCFKPFVEGRYDQKWKEAHLHVGLLISFGDCITTHFCPAYSE